MAATVFTPSAGVLNGDDTNPNTSFRVRCVLTAASSGKLQVTFTASTATGLTASNASIGKWDGTNNPFTTTVPVELKFGGASGFSIAAGGTITSDLTDHSAAFSLALGDSVLVDLDCTSPGGQRYRGSNSNVDTWYAIGATSWNLQNPAGYSKLAGVDYTVEKVETDSASGVNGSLTATIATVTQSASGKLIVQGSASQTIAAFTQSATGKVIKSGSFAQTIGPVTQSATGKLIVSGLFSGTIGDFTLSASGGAAVSGSVNATIDPVALSANGSVVIQGSFGQTIDPVTLVAAGSSAELPEIEGQLDQTIGPVGLDAVGRIGTAQRGDDTPKRRPFVFEEQSQDEPEPAKRTVKRKVTLKRIEKAIELPDPGIPASWIPEPAQAKAFLPAQIAIPSFEAGDEQAIIAAVRDMIVQQAIEQDEEDIEMLLMVA